ncbi:DNA-processing protein DprA [Polynucleobacter sp. es-EL-1]|uniref:DNA-processing protein DprA n=1 Tax=Polynucleobacter sp. es-EL-1 TaxID=1855652 RepID=UPI001BFCE996|nr:DNA-processing protein DprA [Polynucleobacter sp. es-EL-1]QWE10586.1 DNA-protecting protein DprA [Polynucleobacter sp. es-EL-1]
MHTSKQSQNSQIFTIGRNTSDYPSRLLDLADPPQLLYIVGNPALLNLPMLAIVGSRNASPEGLKHGHYFAQSLASEGLLVISGLARGIDGAAHYGAIGSNGNHPTIAVCGTGLDVVYPKEHHYLAKKIGNCGLLISELAPGTGPTPGNFPRRNRIIAALSLGVLVIEAAEKSGSLITARLACELGREVFALPGSIRNPLAKGCHQLIQQGAKLVQGPRDILEELHF